VTDKENTRFLIKTYGPQIACVCFGGGVNRSDSLKDYINEENLVIFNPSKTYAMVFKRDKKKKK